MADDRVLRTAVNEARFRDINERLGRDMAGLVDDAAELAPFVCECGRSTCADRLELTLAEYEAVHADRRQFAVVAGHELPDVEDVLVRHERYLVIRKRPDAWPLVERPAAAP